jgi:predicted aspartyl protease
MNPSKQLELREPSVRVLIDHPNHYGTTECKQFEAFGLLDTGATLVVIPWTMAQSLGLNRIAKRDVQTPSGRHRASIFIAMVTIPELGMVHEVEVASIIGGQGGDIESQPPVLLGKSLLQHFNFCMLGPEKRYTLTVPN